jgi:Tfp pilus assembly pilus retraction ATPase PilT
VNTVEDALEFWTEYKGQPANQREIGYITKGFNKELDK